VGASEPAEKLGDRYAVYGEIASGGMASVHFARLVGPVGFSRTVAVKRLHANLREQPEFVRMFLDEARLATRVRHPNVVATIDVIETSTQICLVMEYVHGEALRRLARAAMSQAGRVPRRIATAIIVGALHGLHAAHEAKNERGEPLNIVHRDVSPHNIIVGTDGIARVIDFGIAKARGQLRDTDAGMIKGKFAYMAPEQLVGATVTRAADIYAASVVLWELFTGRRLFGSKIDATVLERASVRIAPPSSIVPSLSPALDGIVLRGLSPDPEQRFTSARAMARAIEDCIAPASSADVGEWVERMAHDHLAQRERQLEEIDAREGPDGIAELKLHNDPTLDRRTGGYADESGPVSESAVVPAQSHEVVSPPGNASNPPVSIEGYLPLPLPRVSLVGPQASEIDTLELLPGGRAAPYVEPSTTIDSLPRTGVARRPLWGRFWFALLFSLTCLIVGVSVEATGYVTKNVGIAAAARGLSFTVGEVVFRPSAIILTGNHVEPVRLSDVALGVGDVEIALRHLAPNGVLVRGFQASLHGPLGEVTSNIESWAAAASQPLSCEARSGHLEWTDPFGEGTFLEAWDVALASSASQLTLTSPSVMIRTPHGKLGPWKIRYERALHAPGSEARLEVSFDPSLPNAGLTWMKQVAPGFTKVSGALELPRTTLSRIGIPSDALGLLGDVEVAGKVAFASRVGGIPPVEGQILLSFFGLRGVGARTSTSDAAIVGRLAGDKPGSLELQEGQVGVGSSRGRATGTLAVEDAGIRLDLTLAWPPGTKLPSAVQMDTRDVPAWGKR
jgi:serine/threonine protein kinase